MNRRASLLIVAGLLSAPAYSQQPPRADDKPKSVVLKEHAPPGNPFRLKVDHSLDEYWDEFMLMKKANAGDPVAQHELGIRYLTGEGFFPDTTKAAYWIGKAAAQNLITAHYNYGILLNNGMGVEWNPFEAYKNFKFAAFHGLPEGEYAYGLQLTDNLVVQRDYQEAYRWIKMASDSGYKPAREVLGEFRARGLIPKAGQENDSGHSPVQEDTSAGQSTQLHPVFLDFGADSVKDPDNGTLLQDALNEGRIRADSAARITLTDSNENGLDRTTIRALRDAADWGSPEALTFIGRIYEKGIGVKRDIVEASMYYVRALRFESQWASLLLWELVRTTEYFPALRSRVDAGDPEAMFVWAELVSLGLDHQLTDAQGLELLEKSANANCPQALVELGVRYYGGTGLAADRQTGKALMDHASGAGDKEAKIRLAMIGLMEGRTLSTDTTSIATLLEANGRGSVLAEAMLGFCYKEGKGVRGNTAKAVYYYRKASQRGSKNAYDALRNLYDELRPKVKEFRVEE